MDVGDLTEEDIWKSLDEDAEGGFGSVGEFGGAVSETNTTGSDPGGRVGAGERFADAGVERVISKRTYCQQCPHFGTTAGSRLWSRGNDYRRVGRVRRVPGSELSDGRRRRPDIRRDSRRIRTVRQSDKRSVEFGPGALTTNLGVAFLLGITAYLAWERVRARSEGVDRL